MGKRSDIIYYPKRNEVEIRDGSQVIVIPHMIKVQ